MNSTEINIEDSSGFCFGVCKTINKAEDEIAKLAGEGLFCLGEIVHNEMETERLRKLGVKFISYEEYGKLHDERVLLRAHGEPPEIYQTALKNSLEIIDTTCPIVLKLQQKIRKASLDMDKVGGQVVLFGTKNHPETIALNGNTGNKAIVLESLQDENLDKIDFTRPMAVFSQTTKSKKKYRALCDYLMENYHNPDLLFINQTLCNQVSGREDNLREFSANHNLVIFAGGTKSSNAKVLFSHCREANPNSHFISTLADLNNDWFKTFYHKIGICGATSTPFWFLEEVKNHINSIITAKYG